MYAASFLLDQPHAAGAQEHRRIGRPTFGGTRLGPPGLAAARFVGLYLAAGIVAVGLIALPAIAIPQWILRTVFTAEYAAGYWVLRLMGVYLLLRVFDTIVAQYVIMVRMDKVFCSVHRGRGSRAGRLADPGSSPFAAAGAAIALMLGELVLSAIYVWTMLFHIGHISHARSMKPAHETLKIARFFPC